MTKLLELECATPDSELVFQTDEDDPSSVIVGMDWGDNVMANVTISKENVKLLHIWTGRILEES